MKTQKTRQNTMLKTINGYWKVTDDGTKKTSELLEECKKLFPVVSYYADGGLDKQFPPPPTPTTRRFKSTVEADKELQNLSAEDLEKRGGEYMTIRERIILEKQYFEKTLRRRLWRDSRLGGV